MKDRKRLTSSHSLDLCRATQSHMKKTAFIMSTFMLILIMCFSSGCVNKNKTVVTDNTVVLADFDTWQTGFQLMRFANNFGEVSMNTDKAYVKDGVGSAKLQPLGGYATKNNPTIYFPLKSTLFEYNYCDFSKVEKISVDIMNTEKEDVKVTMGLISSIIDTQNIEKASKYTRKLKTGWTTIEYYLDLNVLNIAYDITNFKGVYFEFENANSRDLEDASVIYLDNLKIHNLNEPIKLTNLVTLDKNEICDFEKSYQTYIVTGEAIKLSCMPKFDIVGGIGGVSPSSGNKMLRVKIGAGDVEAATWPKLVIAEKIMQTSEMKKIDKSQYAKTYFAFDIYNNSDKSITFFPEFYTAGGGGWQAFNCIAVPYNWVTAKFSFSEISNGNLADPGAFKLAWAEFTPSFNSEVEFFLDNIRIIQE